MVNTHVRVRSHANVDHDVIQVSYVTYLLALVTNVYACNLHLTFNLCMLSVHVHSMHTGESTAICFRNSRLPCL